MPEVPNTILFPCHARFLERFGLALQYGLGIGRFGPYYTAAGSAVLIMGISGGAILPMAGHFSIPAAHNRRIGLCFHATL